MADNSYHRQVCVLDADVAGKDVLLKISETNLPEFQKYQNLLSLTPLERIP
ncbi:hypothetical protein [Sphingobacterium wenxiniae]|uniref:hypothetical protein n=1 Tax=Sphingobacterium wenxiniae TaxID=683125 RepID=UPI001480175E|nr:hypothetical protein [Sphingobacterium wenxiniae]